jgi:hypothetical protein
MEKKFKKGIQFGNIYCTVRTKDGYWSVTYDKYIGKRFESGGHSREEIQKHFPELKQFLDLHLSDLETGEPMHFVANGQWFLDKLYVEGYTYTIETIMMHFRLSKEEAGDLIAKYHTDEDFRFKLFCNKQRERYQKESEAAVKLLEEIESFK